MQIGVSPEWLPFRVKPRPGPNGKRKPDDPDQPDDPDNPDDPNNLDNYEQTHFGIPDMSQLQVITDPDQIKAIKFMQ